MLVERRDQSMFRERTGCKGDGLNRVKILRGLSMKLAFEKASSLMVACVAIASIAVPAMAEEKSLAIEEIVVTARKVEESSQSVPVAITAISKELNSSTIRDLRDLNGFAPNVQINEDGSRGGGGASITIRGISPTRSDDNSFDSPIGVMIDGIFLGSLAGQVLENFDLERVEILRGPQGTLFGKNTVGGVFHVMRSRPTGELGGRFKATLGEDGQQELRAVFNAPLIEDVLAGKFFFTTQQDDGFMKNVTIGGDTAAKDYMNYGVTLLLTPTDAFEATLTLEQFKDESQLGAFHTNYNLQAGVLAPPTDPNETDYSGGFAACTTFDPSVCRSSTRRPGVSENNTENEAELETDAITLNMSYDLNEDMTLVSVTGYRDLDEYRIYDFDASAAPYITIERWNEYDQFSQELRLDANWGDFTVTAGAYYWNSEFEQDWVTGGQFWATLFGAVAQTPALWQACLGGAFAPIACDSGITGVPAGQDVTQILFETQETTSTAVFAQADWNFAEDWTVTAGLRWTEEEKDFKAGQSYLSNVERQRLRNFPEFADLSNKWTELSPKVGITYQVTDDAILYASYSEGFHSGGFFGVNQNTRDFIRDQYDPEFAKSWEAGLKSQWVNNRLRLNVTAFRNDFEDKQESSVQVDPDTRTVASTFDNVASAIYQGIELETRFVVSEHVELFLNYGYLDAEYEDFFTDINAADGITLIQDASFLEPRNSPESTIGIGGTYSVRIGEGDLEVYAKYARVDDVETNLLNTPLGHLAAQDDVTASIGYYADNYSVSVFGRNLTDERTETFIPISDLFAAGSVNRPRTYGVEFLYEF